LAEQQAQQQLMAEAGPLPPITPGRRESVQHQQHGAPLSTGNLRLEGHAAAGLAGHPVTQRKPLGATARTDGKSGGGGGGGGGGRTSASASDATAGSKPSSAGSAGSAAGPLVIGGSGPLPAGFAPLPPTSKKRVPGSSAEFASPRARSAGQQYHQQQLEQLEKQRQLHQQQLLHLQQQQQQQQQQHSGHGSTMAAALSNNDGELAIAGLGSPQARHGRGGRGDSAGGGQDALVDGVSTPRSISAGAFRSGASSSLDEFRLRTSPVPDLVMRAEPADADAAFFVSEARRLLELREGRAPTIGDLWDASTDPRREGGYERVRLDGGADDDDEPARARTLNTWEKDTADWGEVQAPPDWDAED
jgi:hypothetical protein